MATLESSEIGAPRAVRVLVATQIALGLAWLLVAAAGSLFDHAFGIPVGWSEMMVGPGRVPMLFLGPTMIGCAVLARVGAEAADLRVSWGLVAMALSNTLAGGLGMWLLHDTSVAAAPLAPWPTAPAGPAMALLIVLWILPWPLALADGIAAILSRQAGSMSPSAP